MEHRRLGRTEIEASVIGFGTNELRLVPERQAIETLLRGFELGVNIVHTSPDYEGAEDLVAQAVAESGQAVVVASQGYDIHGNADGPVDHFERLFEATCERLRTERLDLYGIAAVDDREAFGENVWGQRGMVEFLLRKKEEGRLGSIFCTNHGDPAHVRRLVESGVFDAVMLSYNPLGFHLLTLNPPPGRHFENVPRNHLEIFPLCQERDVGVMVMMPLAGGLLTESKAFPERRLSGPRAAPPGAATATDILRTILQDPAVACVFPGTASLDEADENARAGYAPLAVPAAVQRQLSERVAALQTSLCSRCGACETLCSQHLPVSWLLRAHDMATHPGESFETWTDVEYFRLHPGLEATCLTCPDVTCTCPYGIEVPLRLTQAHGDMVQLTNRGLATPPEAAATVHGDETFGALVLLRDLPTTLRAGETRVCRVYLENRGIRGWHEEGGIHRAGVVLAAFVDGVRVAEARPRDDVHSGGRGHFVFEVTAPTDTASFRLRLQLLGEHQEYSEEAGFVVFEGEVGVTGVVSASSLPPDDVVVTPPPPLRRRKESTWTRGARSLTRLLHARRASNASPLLGPAQSAEPSASVPAVETVTIPVPAQNEAPPPPPPLAPYDLAWISHNLPGTWIEEEPYYVHVEVENRGCRPWRAAAGDAGNAVSLVVRLHGEVRSMTPLPHDIGTGERALIGFPLILPSGLGDWKLSLTFVEQNVAWFDQHGVRSLDARVRRTPAERTPYGEARALARRSNPAFYAPSEGIARSRDGRAYPVLIREASGARVRDGDGNEWIDYVMGWGSALLGYAHPEIRRALEGMLDCGAVTTLPHVVEMDVTRVLCDLLPCAEVVLFGKNGSDACTAAVRAARLHTGRRTILFSGYHGWQEPFAQSFQPALAAPGAPSEAISFRLNDLEGLSTLVRAHAGQIAAIMLEPAAQAEGVDGPVRDCDPAFLRHVAEICRDQGALLIFDEIMTGFRYAQGSVQQATGIVPDLAVFGKALAAGLPLAALVGRERVLKPVLASLFYHPTFKSEVYTFAAADAALRLYRSRDVARQVQVIGTRIKEGVNAISAELDVAGRMIGLPYRMVYRFGETDERRRACQRTLLHQELLKHGILTFRGFMLPSLAHGESEIEQTLRAFRSALAAVKRATQADDYAASLEIPLLV